MSLHAQFVPVVIHHLHGLSLILEKAEQYCEARKINPKIMLEMRLFPDMFPLVKQVQIATDMVKAAGARLAAVEMPSYVDDEVDFAQLRERVTRVIGFLQGLSAEQFVGAESREIAFSAGGRPMQFTGAAYVQYWVLPNFYFHKTTAYNLLRSNGVELGKRDFLG